MGNYANQSHWQDIQRFLPESFRLQPGEEPTETWWPWRQYRIHLDCYRRPEAPVKVILFHGVGTNGRQMSTILGAPLAHRGIETIAVDMPGYGMTQTGGQRRRVRYDDWVQIGSDLIDAERARDARPIVLYGLSAGGMKTYHVAALNRQVKGIVGMTFLDQREQQVRDETALNRMMSRLGIPLARLVAATPLAGMAMPMALASKMHALVNDKAALKACLADDTSAGAWVTMRFLASYAAYAPAIEPEDFDVCPILLTQPAQDRWTPLHLSELFLRRVRRVPVSTVMLENAGHYPLEQPGLDQMVEAVYRFCIAAAAQ
ncbi:alpha/beta hydrolase [Serratia nevei]|uniref:alpha/beta hydrolase n=1 Tax=Serratia nevei TaxID=2703794 RepID=UPI0011C93243|nr:alpha/beta fold hydrolase [Serratia nevei]TXE72513.1 alpha/beta fold hydrolase [Serratia nevei]